MKRAVAIVAFSVLAAAFTAPSARADQILSYGFSPDASMTVDGVTFLISGTFGYDVNTESGVNLDITLTVPTLGSETFTQYFSGITPIDAPEDLAYLGTSFNNNFMGLAFDSSLALDAIDPLITGFDVGCSCGIVDDFASAVTGSADPVPEPASLALLAIGLVGFGFLRRRKRKAE